MAKYSQKKTEALLEQGRVGLGNAQDTPEILDLLTAYGMGTEKLQEGQTLHQNLNDEHAAQLRLYAQQKEATAAFKAAWSDARKMYMRHTKIARALLAARPELLDRIGLSGARAKAFGEWLDQAR
jgi:hypothetical protein